jgi:hypothetical protein
MICTCKKLVGCEAVIAAMRRPDKPAPTGFGVHLQEIGRLSGRHHEQAHSHKKQIGIRLLLFTTHQAER